MNEIIAGLTEDEARARLIAEGFNELPGPARRTPLRIIFEVLREPMFALLLAAGLIYLLLGDLGEALIIVAFAALSTVITIVQEARTERVLEALRDLTSPRAAVIRDGERKVIAGRDVVRGDIILLAEGDRVAADCRLIEAQDLQADESLLTGESVPVRKAVSDLPSLSILQPGGDDLPVAFAGSMIVRGSARAEVTATGSRSQIGKIGQSLRSLESEPPRLQAETSRLVRISAVGAALVTLLTIVLYATLRSGWLDALLAGIAIGMSMLPEEFPVIMTVFMAMGAWRISKANVLTRRAAAIETLGAATVLCTDKTGTLTENRMTVTELRVAGDCDLPLTTHTVPPGLGEDFDRLADTAALASAPDPFDPMEKAFHAFARGRALAAADERGWRLVKTFALQRDLLAMTQLWRMQDSGLIAACKGAPEVVAELCGLEGVALDHVRSAIATMAEKGLRVLGVARAALPGDTTPPSQRQFDFEFLGLIGLSDPLRQSVPAAIADCRAAGIRVAMITGDFPITARAIGEQAGLETSGILTGADINQMSDPELAERVKTTNVFARIMPEQKLRIVQALKANGEIVAMTGDGVNDAPSLKAAHIGIAMGARGTDVAREASSLVLLNDDFGSIVNAIRLGRRIYDNLRKAMGFIVAVHVPIAGLTLLPLLTGLPILFWPIHIAFLEMIIDPVCSLVFEAEVEERNAMQRPPRRPDAPLFTWQLIGWSLLQGAITFGAVAAAYVVALDNGLPTAEARALAFSWLVLALICLILVNRSFSTSLPRAFSRPNPSLAWVVAAVAAILGLSLFWPAASELFHFGRLALNEWAVAAAFFLGLLLLLETLKSLLTRYVQL